VYSPAGNVVPFTCVGAPISKLPLWDSLAAKALVVNASARVANMIRENNGDFIYRSLDSFPQCGGNRLRAAFLLSSNQLFNSLLIAYNSSRG
jgi:hypothetical protein